MDSGLPQALDSGHDQSMDFAQPLDLSARPDLPPVTPQEVVSSLQSAQGYASSSLLMPRRASSVVSGAAPGTLVLFS